MADQSQQRGQFLQIIDIEKYCKELVNGVAVSSRLQASWFRTINSSYSLSIGVAPPAPTPLGLLERPGRVAWSLQNV